MDTELARHRMVAQQIRTWAVFDANILSTLDIIARDRFVPTECENVAYADTEIPLPHGQCMLRPAIVGRLLQALDIEPDQNVLEIGTGTGYLTACLAKLAGTVTSIDIYNDFVALAEKNLRAAGIDNVVLHCMDVIAELPEGPFDAIAMTCAVPKFHEAYGELLKPGGRLFVIAGHSPSKTALLVTRNQAGQFEIDELFETDVPQLVNLEQEAIFSF